MYSYLREKCGVLETKTTNKSSPGICPDPKMVSFRKRKRLCRKAWRNYKANDMLHTPEAKALKKRWLTLVRQHNRRRIHLEKKKNRQSSAKANAAFKRDPFTFADRLFNGKKTTSEPTFSKDDAESFFTNTYSDTDRG